MLLLLLLANFAHGVVKSGAAFCYIYQGTAPVNIKAMNSLFARDYLPTSDKFHPILLQKDLFWYANTLEHVLFLLIGIYAFV